MRIPFALLCVTLATPAAAQQVDTRADAARAKHLGQVAEQTEACDIGRRVHVRGGSEHGIAGSAIQGQHDPCRLLRVRVGRETALDRSCQDAEAEGLRE